MTVLQKRDKYIAQFQVRAVERLRKMAARLSTLQSGAEDTALAEDFRRDLDTFKGEALLLGLKATAQMASPIEEQFSKLRESGLDPASSHLTQLLGECTDLADALEEALPSSDQLGAAAQMGEPRARDEESSLSVVVAEDSDFMLSLLVQLLEDAGFSVRGVTDGQQALDEVRQNRPDLLLTDIEMPNMNGFELLEAVRSDSATRDLAVVVLTVRMTRDDRRRARELGASAYLSKSDFRPLEWIGEEE